VGNFSGQDRMYRNPGPPNWQHVDVTGTVLPGDGTTTLGEDGCDIDHDGDYDILVANDGGQAEALLKNGNNIADTTAPRVGPLEQVAGPPALGAPTPVRVHVYDNASWDVTRYDDVDLEYSTNGGANWSSVPMRYAGGQLFRGEIPGSVSGTVHYRVRATDEHNNTAVSVTKNYTGGCPPPVNYCTAGVSSSGCSATMSASGVPSAGATSGFTLQTSNVEGQKQGLIFYGVSGRLGSPWAPGNSSFLCVKPAVQRTPAQNSGGTAGGSCSGTFSIDWLAYMAANPFALGQPISSGLVVDSQAWYRDPSAPATTNLSNGLEFTVCP
jgi:hypothetical protein